jgi:hypothetical protein
VVDGGPSRKEVEMASSKSKHTRMKSRRRQRWKRRLKTKKAAVKNTAKK